MDLDHTDTSVIIFGTVMDEDETGTASSCTVSIICGLIISGSTFSGHGRGTRHPQRRRNTYCRFRSNDRRK